MAPQVRPVREALRIVVRDRRAFYGLNVVLGALCAEPPPGRWSVRFARTREALTAEIGAGCTEADRVLVMWSFFSPEVPEVAAELATLRADPAAGGERVVHLAGGVHASGQPGATEALGFDLVAVGEGEATFVAVVGALAGGASLDEVRRLPGIWGSGIGAARDELGRWPAWASRWRRFNPIEITRGCIYACRFCQTPFLFKASFRHRPVDDVRAHVRELRSHGLRYVRFVTPTALSYGTDGRSPDLDAVEALLAACREELGDDGRLYFGSFPSEVRPEHVTREAVALIRRYADNDTLVIGAQSGSERVLELTHRGHGTGEVERAVRIAVEGGLRPDVDLLFGLPGEEPEDAAATMAFGRRLAELGARLHAHTFMPLPGTPFSDAAPGRVDPAAGRALEQLASEGTVHGQWKGQQRRAEQMVPFVRRRPVRSRPPGGTAPGSTPGTASGPAPAGAGGGRG